MKKIIERASGVSALWVVAQALSAQAPASVPDLSGMWSDPPARAEDAFCHVGCTVVARDYLTELLEDEGVAPEQALGRAASLLGETQIEAPAQ